MLALGLVVLFVIVILVGREGRQKGLPPQLKPHANTIINYHICQTELVRSIMQDGSAFDAPMATDEDRAKFYEEAVRQYRKVDDVREKINLLNQQFERSLGKDLATWNEWKKSPAYSAWLTNR